MHELIGFRVLPQYFFDGSAGSSSLFRYPARRWFFVGDSFDRHDAEFAHARRSVGAGRPGSKFTFASSAGLSDLWSRSGLCWRFRRSRSDFGRLCIGLGQRMRHCLHRECQGNWYREGGPIFQISANARRLPSSKY